MPTSQHTFIRANTDDSDEQRPGTDFVAGVNLHLEPGQVFPATGNVLVAGLVPPATGTTTGLGGLEDGSTGTSIHFYYNSAGAHRLVRYNPLGNGGAGSETVLLEWAGLNLAADLPIGVGVNGGIIDGLLVYRDADGECRCVNLARAASGGYSAGYLAAEPFALHLVKVPPTFVVTATRQLLSTGAPGELLRIIQRKAYQFSYRYRYVDGEVTVLAPFSKWLDILTDPAAVTFNTIALQLPAAIPAGVTEVELLVREAATLTWQIADTIRRDGQGNLSTAYSFYGQLFGGAPADAETTRLFEALWPAKAGPTLARSRVHLADTLEGYPVPEPAFAVSLLSMAATAIDKATLHERSTYRVTVQFYDALGRVGGCSQPQTVSVPARASGNTLLNYLRVTLTASGPQILNAEIPSWAYSYQVLVARNDRTTRFFQGQAADALGYSGERRTINQDTGAVVDTHRFSNVNTSNHQQAWVDIGNWPGAGQGYIWQAGDVMYIRSINKEFVITKQVGDYLEIPYSGGIPNDSQGHTVPFIEVYTPNTTPSEVYYERGPRLRIVRDSQGNRSYEQAVIDLEGDCYLVPLFFANIVRSDEYLLDSNNNKDYEPATSATLVESMVPPFRLAPTRTAVTTDYTRNSRGTFLGNILSNPLNIIPGVLLYNEIKYLTGSPDAVRDGNTIEQADTANRDSAALLWLDMRYGGRPSAVVPKALQQKRRIIERFSGQKQQDNLINGLSRWEALNQYDKLPQEQSGVTALVLADQSQTDGSVLLALQERGIVSLYLGQQPIKTGADEILIAQSDQVIGADNTLKGGFGCTDPATICAYAGKVFYYCRERAEAVRYHNGLVPLGLTYRFRFRLQALTALYAQARVSACFDPRREEYWLTFHPVGDLPGATAFWSERNQAWGDEYATIPTAGAPVGNELVTWNGAALHRHTPTAPVGTFFGRYVAPSVTFVAAQPGGGLAKTWQQVSVRSQAQWVPTVLTTQAGQRSRILPAWQRFIQGVWRATVRRDENTAGTQPLAQKLSNGRVLQSESLRVTLTCPEANPAPLVGAGVDFLVNSGQQPNQ